MSTKRKTPSIALTDAEFQRALNDLNDRVKSHRAYRLSNRFVTPQMAEKIRRASLEKFERAAKQAKPASEYEEVKRQPRVQTQDKFEQTRTTGLSKADIESFRKASTRSEDDETIGEMFERWGKEEAVEQKRRASLEKFEKARKQAKSMDEYEEVKRQPRVATQDKFEQKSSTGMSKAEIQARRDVVKLQKKAEEEAKITEEEAEQVMQMVEARKLAAKQNALSYLDWIAEYTSTGSPFIYTFEELEPLVGKDKWLYAFIAYPVDEGWEYGKAYKPQDIFAKIKFKILSTSTDITYGGYYRLQVEDSQGNTYEMKAQTKNAVLIIDRKEHGGYRNLTDVRSFRMPVMKTDIEQRKNNIKKISISENEYRYSLSEMASVFRASRRKRKTSSGKQKATTKKRKMSARRTRA